MLYSAVPAPTARAMVRTTTSVNAGARRRAPTASLTSLSILRPDVAYGLARGTPASVPVRFPSWIANIPFTRTCTAPSAY